jgi:hypothetical protein
LQLDGAPHSLGRAVELDKQIIAGRLYDAARMLGDFGKHESIAMCLQLFESAVLVRADQSRVAHDFSS